MINPLATTEGESVMALLTKLSISALLIFSSNAFATEICHYRGTTDHSGKIEAETQMTSTANGDDLRVLVNLDAKFLFPEN